MAENFGLVGKKYEAEACEKVPLHPGRQGSRDMLEDVHCAELS